MEPGVETLGLAEPRELAPGRDERLLHGVLGPVDVTQDPMRDGEEPIRRAAGEGGEGLLVPGSSRQDERPIHAALRWGASRLDASTTMSAADVGRFDIRQPWPRLPR